jgi:hypothetical protein
MAKMTGAQVAEKWGRRLKGATQDIQNGINNVTSAPGAAAAAQVNTMKNNLNKAIDDGTWQRQVSRVSLDDWKKAALNKGVGRISAGVDGAANKAAASFDKVLSAVDGALGAIASTPRGDLEQNIQRSATFQREMAKRAPKRQG